MRDIDNWSNSKIGVLNQQSCKLFGRMDGKNRGVKYFNNIVY